MAVIWGVKAADTVTEEAVARDASMSAVTVLLIWFSAAAAPSPTSSAMLTAMLTASIDPLSLACT